MGVVRLLKQEGEGSREGAMGAGIIVIAAGVYAFLL